LEFERLWLGFSVRVCSHSLGLGLGLGVQGFPYSSHNANKKQVTAWQSWNHCNTCPCRWDWAVADAMLN